MAKTKFEALIEHIINDNNEKASELFHEIVVQKSREIYSDIVSEDLDDMVVNEFSTEDQSDDFENDIESDEEGLTSTGDDTADFDMSGDMSGDMDSEASDDMDDFEMSDDTDMEMSDDADLSDDSGIDDMSTDDSEVEPAADMEDRVVDLETALDDLKAEFDALMSDESEEEEHVEDEVAEEGVVREYIEKAPEPVRTEKNVNAKSVVASKNDMGGTAKNIAKGGSNPAPDGKSAPSAAKPPVLKNAIDPRKAAKTAFGKKAPAATTTEKSVNDKSVL